MEIWPQFFKSGNFCGFLVVFLHTNPLLKKGSTLGANSSLIEQSPAKKGRKTILEELPLLKEYLPRLKEMDTFLGTTIVLYPF